MKLSEEETIKQVENAIWFMKEDNYNVNTFVKAIQGLLDLYKEKNKQIQVEIEGRNILVGLNENLKEELKKEKEKNKELYEDNQKQWEERCKLAIELDNNTVSKDELRKILKENSEYGVYLKITELLEEE